MTAWEGRGPLAPLRITKRDKRRPYVLANPGKATGHTFGFYIWISHTFGFTSGYRWDEFSHRNSPKPSLEKALKTSLKAAVPKSEAEKLIRTIYAAALDEAGASALT